MAYKVFTNGSTLQASELNENLMQQSIATFSNAAARTAAITSPVEGQMTYLLDTDRYSMWTGSSWVSPFGLTLLNTTTVTAQTAVNIDNVFTSDYDHYKVIVTYRTNGSCGFFVQLRAAGSTIAGTDYKQQFVRSTGTTVSGLSTTAGSTWASFASNGANRNTNVTLTVYDPVRPVQTLMDWSSWVWDGSQFGGTSQGFEGNNAARDGLRFTVDGGFNMTGTIRIYGFRNA